MIKLSEFKQLAESSEHVEFHGPYKGRSFHQGYAVKAEDEYGYTQFCFLLAENGYPEFASVRAHSDSLGLGMVYSWPVNNFEVDTEDE